jgi:hypothetical protein
VARQWMADFVSELAGVRVGATYPELVRGVHAASARLAGPPVEEAESVIASDGAAQWDPSAWPPRIHALASDLSARVLRRAGEAGDDELSVALVYLEDAVVRGLHVPSERTHIPAVLLETLDAAQLPGDEAEADVKASEDRPASSPGKASNGATNAAEPPAPVA